MHSLTRLCGARWGSVHRVGDRALSCIVALELLAGAPEGCTDGGRAGGRRRRWQCGASAESVSASMPDLPKGAFGCGGRKQDERARWSAVVPLALEKRLFLNASCRCLLVALLGKKYCDINRRPLAAVFEYPLFGR